MGLVVWPMVEFEADDAIATAAVRFREEDAVDQVVICSPDKDLAQLVSGNRVVCWDRRRDTVYDQDAVVEKYGVPPASIPDWLALVGDSADGIPGVPTWGKKSASALLSKYQHIEAIPDDIEEWGLSASSCSPACREPGGSQRAGLPLSAADNAAPGRPAQRRRG